MEKLLLKELHEEDFVPELSLLFSIDLDKFKLETQIETFENIVDEYVYIVDLLFNLDFVLNYVASNNLKNFPFLKHFSPSKWKSVQKTCNGSISG